jgi:anti-sigma-K factor RskA
LKGRTLARAVAQTTDRAGSPAKTFGRVHRADWRVWALAASLALATGLGSYALQLRRQLDEAMAALLDATVTVAQLSSELDVTRRDATLLVDTLGVLQAGDLVRVDLAGAGPGAAATGRAFLSRARGVVFRAEGLPLPAVGRTYQLWVVDVGGPVSLGTFDVNPLGMSTVARLAPTGLSVVSAIAVTDEPLGGSSGPTTTPLLAGTVVLN